MVCRFDGSAPQPGYDYILLEAGDTYRLTLQDGKFAYGDVFITQGGGIGYAATEDLFVTFNPDGTLKTEKGGVVTQINAADKQLSMSAGAKIFFEKITGTILYAADGNYYLTNGDADPILLSRSVSGNVTSYSYNGHVYLKETVDGNTVTYEAPNYAKVTVTDGVAGEVTALGTVMEKVKFTESTSNADVSLLNVAVGQNGLSFQTHVNKEVTMTLAGDTTVKKLLAKTLNVSAADQLYGIYSHSKTEGSCDITVDSNIQANVKHFGTADNLVEANIGGTITMKTAAGVFVNQLSGDSKINSIATEGDVILKAQGGSLLHVGSGTAITAANAELYSKTGAIGTADKVMLLALDNGGHLKADALTQIYVTDEAGAVALDAVTVRDAGGLVELHFEGDVLRGDADVNVTAPFLNLYTTNGVIGTDMDMLRASGSDDKARIIPPVVFSLEEALEYIKADEYVEVTPKSMRMRKVILDELERKRANKE